ncbi:MAG: hypothetical protein ABI832_22465 [bacterium]
MRAPFVVMMLCGLAACGPKVPESGPGFEDYNTYIHNSTARPPVSQPIAPATGPTEFSTAGVASAIDAAEAGTTAPAAGSYGAPLDPMALGGGTPTADLPASGERPRGNAPAGIQETTAEMGFVTGGVSDEQDFSAVTNRETIASDAARIEANRAQYVVIQPGALPQRSGDSGPNLAQYAIATNNPVGVKLYSRPSFYLTNVKGACAKYTSSDLAQQAFLASGGPQKDPKALDPDGDGFACDWDPRPFRAALQ